MILRHYLLTHHLCPSCRRTGVVLVESSGINRQRTCPDCQGRRHTETRKELTEEEKERIEEEA